MMPSQKPGIAKLSVKKTRDDLVDDAAAARARTTKPTGSEISAASTAL